MEKKGIVEFGLLWVLLILIAIFLIAIAIIQVLKTIGLQEYGNLIDKLQNLHKYKGEDVTIYLPTYIQAIMFFRGEDGQCQHQLCKDICLDTKGDPGKGYSFIVIYTDKSAKPSTLSILWKTATFRIDKAKADAVKLVVRDACLPRDYEINQMTQQYVYNDVLILEGDRKNGKTYCIKPEEISGKLNINVKEGAC